MFMIKDGGHGLTPGCSKLLNNVEQQKEKPAGGQLTDTPKTAHFTHLCSANLHLQKTDPSSVC